MKVEHVKKWEPLESINQLSADFLNNTVAVTRQTWRLQDLTGASKNCLLLQGVQGARGFNIRSMLRHGKCLKASISSAQSSWRRQQQRSSRYIGCRSLTASSNKREQCVTMTSARRPGSMNNSCSLLIIAQAQLEASPEPACCCSRHSMLRDCYICKHQLLLVSKSATASNLCVLQGGMVADMVEI